MYLWPYDSYEVEKFELGVGMFACNIIEFQTYLYLLINISFFGGFILLVNVNLTSLSFVNCFDREILVKRKCSHLMGALPIHTIKFKKTKFSIHCILYSNKQAKEAETLKHIIIKKEEKNIVTIIICR